MIEIRIRFRGSWSNAFNDSNGNRLFDSGAALSESLPRSAINMPSDLPDESRETFVRWLNKQHAGMK